MKRLRKARRLWGGYTTKVFPNRSVRLEEIEDPGAARAFGAITRLPQYKLIMHLFTIKALSNQRGGRAIDIGCGDGGLAIALARRHLGLKVVGLDLSDEMLDLARSRARKASLGEHVSFKTGNAESIPFPSESFDLVVSTMSLHHWSNPMKVLGEVARILRHGGKCVLADMRRDPVLPFVGLLWFASHFIVPRPLRRIGEPLGSLQSAYTPEEASSMLKKSKLGEYCIAKGGPFWLLIKGRKR
jgi:ubiquinone/menaquinone biosynthesis C-methylase UbiE